MPRKYEFLHQRLSLKVFSIGLGLLVCVSATIGLKTELTAGTSTNAAYTRSHSLSATLSRADRAQFCFREGAKLAEEPGYFRLTGDRIVFFSSQEKTRYVVLENLNLERIANALAERPGQRRWRVSGLLTEFRGENYLLVDKVVIESWDNSVRPSP